MRQILLKRLINVNTEFEEKQLKKNEMFQSDYYIFSDIASSTI